MKRIRYIFLITILLLPFLVNAETEFDDPGKIGGSISLDATKSFFRIIEINLMEEIRLKDDFKKIERFSTDRKSVVLGKCVG